MIEKKVFEAINFRRSVRIFKKTDINKEKVKQCIQNGTLAPNSSNLQLWEFIHVTNKEIQKKITKACLNQNAAKTANQLVIIVVRKDLWRQRAKENANFLKEQSKEGLMSDKSFKMALNYYTKLIPFTYTDFFGVFGVLKSFTAQITGLFRPMYRQLSSSDKRIISHKSAALAAQNFMISMSAIGYDTCPMEGFDSLMVKKILKIPSKAEINMIIGCGIRDKKGIYGKRYRVPFENVYKAI
ncbi:MAG: nitroreductase family protein [Flavobacteriaceae bacterium]|nr:nitroreductase family protein [Flavobacteriaceae bacterium]